MKDQLIDEFRDRSAAIGNFGLGYVKLPLELLRDWLQGCFIAKLGSVLKAIRRQGHLIMLNLYLLQRRRRDAHA